MIGAVLFFVRTALTALSAGVDQASHSCMITDFESFHFFSDLHHTADNFVSRNAGVLGRAPFTPGGVDVRVAEAARLEAIELLALATKDQAGAALRACLNVEQVEKVQAAAVMALNEVDGKEMGKLLTLWTDLKPKARNVLLETLLARDVGALSLLAEMGAGRGGPTPGDLTASHVQALVQNQNVKVASLAKTVLAAVIPLSREAVFKTFQPALSVRGNVAAGEQVFLSRCLACHEADGQGVEVGPNLVTVKTKGRQGLLTAILEPHQEVASQYISYTIQTKDGETLIGLISQDDASSMTLKMMGGAQITLQRSNIQSCSSTGKSLMPEGIEQGMTVEDMADLLAFIEQLK